MFSGVANSHAFETYTPCFVLKLRGAACLAVAHGAAARPERHVFAILVEPRNAQDRPGDGCTPHPDFECVPLLAETSEVLFPGVWDSPVVSNQIMQATFRALGLPDDAFWEQRRVGDIVDRPESTSNSMQRHSLCAVAANIYIYIFARSFLAARNGTVSVNRQCHKKLIVFRSSQQLLSECLDVGYVVCSGPDVVEVDVSELELDARASGRTSVIT